MQNKTEGFTLSLALMDILPVLFFSISAGALAIRFKSTMFLLGTMLVISAGVMKVLWKLLLALIQKDVHFLNRQMRYVMPAGFVLSVIALIKDHDLWSMKEVLSYALTLPSMIFFILALIGIILMIYFSHHFDQTDAKSNWIEQTVNVLAQFFFMMGILI